MMKINLSKYDQLSGLGHFIKTDFVTKQLDIKDKKRLKQHNNNRHQRIKSKMTSKSYQALGRLPKGVMNQTETAYAQYLELQKKTGEILDYRFEQVRFSMASNTNYLPDFLVINKNREVEFHEVKGRWEDDARVKIKVAQRQNPWFKFVAVMKKRVKDGGGWRFEEFAE